MWLILREAEVNWQTAHMELLQCKLTDSVTFHNTWVLNERHAHSLSCTKMLNFKVQNNVSETL
jgi:hypothetical protein